MEGAASTVEAADFTAGQVASMEAASVEARGISARHAAAAILPTARREAVSTARDFEDGHLQTDFVQAHRLPGAQTQA
jgi:hypothetical protein